MSSPRKNPTTIPAARPVRTCVARLVLVLLRDLAGARWAAEVVAHGDARRTAHGWTWRIRHARREPLELSFKSARTCGGATAAEAVGRRVGADSPVLRDQRGPQRLGSRVEDELRATGNHDPPRSSHPAMITRRPKCRGCQLTAVGRGFPSLCYTYLRWHPYQGLAPLAIDFAPTGLIFV